MQRQAHRRWPRSLQETHCEVNRPSPGHSLRPLGTRFEGRQETDRTGGEDTRNPIHSGEDGESRGDDEGDEDEDEDGSDFNYEDDHEYNNSQGIIEEAERIEGIARVEDVLATPALASGNNFGAGVKVSAAIASARGPGLQHLTTPELASRNSFEVGGNAGEAELSGTQSGENPPPGPSHPLASIEPSASSLLISSQKPLQSITISDDRSTGSEFQTNRRILQALKPREGRLGQSLLYLKVISTDGPASSNLQGSVALNVPLRWDADFAIPVHENESVEKYFSFGSHIGGITENETEASGIPIVPRPLEASEFTAFPQNTKLSLEEKSVEMAFRSPNGEDHLPGLSSVTSIATNSIGTNPALVSSYTKLELKNKSVAQPAFDQALPIQNEFEDSKQGPPLNILPPMDASTLGVPDASTLSLESLRAYIQDLQGKATKLKTLERNSEPFKVQIIHRTMQKRSSQLYLDKPQWLVGETGSRVLSSKLLVADINSYLNKHPEIAFVVYRDYDDTANNSGEEGDALPQTKHNREHVLAVAKDLVSAVTRLLETVPEFSDMCVEFRRNKSLWGPYLVVYHARSTINDFLHTLTDQQRRQLELLFRYVLSVYSEEFKKVDALLDSGKIVSSYVGYLFKPGDILVEGQGLDIRGVLSKSWLFEEEQVGSWRSSSHRKMVTRWGIATSSWRFNGVFSQLNATLFLEMDANDQSEKLIDDLNLRPLRFINKDRVELLRHRGEMFWKCRSRHFVSYHEDKDREFHHSGDERYMIDLKTYGELHPPDKNLHHKETDIDSLEPIAMESDTAPDPNFVFLVPLMIKGYNLKQKKWLDLRVDRLSEVVWNKEAFKSLVLDNKTKGLIQALIINQLDAEKSTDIISGKGNGLILLLHGGPGTGKTLTAESVAEIAEKPLYSVTCGDIGTEPEHVEVYLESVLHLGKTWGCVVLLDEADVFLEQRTLADLQRNALVSVFLRGLEYYDGILVLTSNRVGTFDEAFKSRIQLALHYANLSTFQRVQIWRNFIERLKKLEVENIDVEDLEDHLEDLSKEKMNGRQIRNAITTARQYAKWKGDSLNYLLLKDIIETSGRFDIYLEKLNGGYSQDQLAEDEGIRLAGST